MKLHPDHHDDLNAITAYGTGWVEVNGARHEGPLLLRPQGPARPWSIDGLAALTPETPPALAGPRPALPQGVAEYASGARRRLLVKPGLTGLWQVSGRSDLSWDSTVALDRHYVENRGAQLDVEILANTLKAVVGGRGAY